jgi:hypothetical protein
MSSHQPKDWIIIQAEAEQSPGALLTFFPYNNV